MSALVDRISEVQRKHRYAPFMGICPCGFRFDIRESHEAHVAERVAEALPDFEWLMARLDNAEKMVYANIGPSPVLVEIRAAKKLLADQPEEKS